MKLRHIIIVFSILLLTYFGYTLQPKNTHTIQDIVNTFTQTNTPKVDHKPEIEPFLGAFESYFLEKFKEYGSVGAAVAVVYKGQIVYLKPFGVKKIGTKDSVNIHTVFRLASVSKGFAGVIGSITHHKKLINLDAPIISYLPDFKLQKTTNTQKVTLRNTLGHTSGLVGYSFDVDIEGGVPFSVIYKKLQLAKINAEPGKLYAYQNVMYSLLDTVLHKKTGKNYSAHINELIFKPLKMNDASIDAASYTKSNNYAHPHKGWGQKTYAIALNKKYYQVKPAAGVNASISDMSKWLLALMGHAPEVISKQVLADVSTGQVFSPVRTINTRNWGNVTNKQYGMGWRVITLGDKKVMYHGGFVDGYRAEIAYCKDKEIGIVLLQNSANRLALEAIPLFMKSYFEFTDTQSYDSILAADSATSKKN